MKRAVIGMLAHVDAGKTTLSEALLYEAGAILKRGRVDHGDSFLDNFSEERRRGITIFAKQAVLETGDCRLTLLDTPGHVDLSPETERTLDVLDAAVLVISGPEGVQSHTVTLWDLLKKRGIPVFLFINKCDLPGPDRSSLLAALSERLSGTFFDMAGDAEPAACCREDLLEEYLENGSLSEASLARIIKERLAFPCRFGSALKLEGVKELLEDLLRFAPPCGGDDKAAFSGQVYKISRDGNLRLTHLKVTGGTLRAKDLITSGSLSEKVNQLRLYSGGRFSSPELALPGDVVAAAGPEHTHPGQILGRIGTETAASLEPVMTYRLLLPEGTDPLTVLPKLRQLEEEEPSLKPVWDGEHKELWVSLMGPVQKEILTVLLKDRFGLTVGFGPGRILYRETITNAVEGVGHYEPLRHYAEVHLLLEPGPRDSGLQFASACRTDLLAQNWQRLILTHLNEKIHRGVLIGAPVTDMKITLLTGRAHEKHTEGGDFREATYRALRQGLMQADCLLLEPLYRLELVLPTAFFGRAMTDLKARNAELSLPEDLGGTTRLCGTIPASKLGEYPLELNSYTHGASRLSLSFGGYAPCPDQAALVEEAGYKPEADLENTPDSVFCDHGAGFSVPWNEVPKMMHLPLVTAENARRAAGNAAAEAKANAVPVKAGRSRLADSLAADKELLAIFERTYGKVKTDRLLALRSASPKEKLYKGREQYDGTEYILVDGYNLIFAWEELRRLAEDDLERARISLTERLQNYQGYKGVKLLLIFDAYRVKGGQGSVTRHGDFSLIFTKEAETADMYIEKATYSLAEKHRMRVVTSDALEQMIILGHGALREPALSFAAEVKATEAEIRSLLED